MAQVVLKLSTSEAEVESKATSPKLSVIEGKSKVTRDIIFLGCVLCTLQVLDGLLTAVGVQHFGISAEGNTFIRWAMEQMGHIPALVTIKSVALLIVLVLCSLATRVAWLTPALRGVAVIYLGAAVVPWSYIILTRII